MDAPTRLSKQNRHSGYRLGPSSGILEGERYDTVDPRVGLALARNADLLPPGPAWECAAGCGALVDALRAGGIEIGAASDVVPRRSDVAVRDALAASEMPSRCTCIITNAPFSLHDRFVAHGLDLTEPVRGGLAILSPMSFIVTPSRRALLTHRAYVGCVACCFRVRWFSDVKAALPPTVFAWHVWNWQRDPDASTVLRLDFGDDCTAVEKGLSI